MLSKVKLTRRHQNYCIVAFGIWLTISLIQWFVDGRKNYTGPAVTTDDHVLVAAPTEREHERVGTSSSSEKASGNDASAGRTKYM